MYGSRKRKKCNGYFVGLAVSLCDLDLYGSSLSLSHCVEQIKVASRKKPHFKSECIVETQKNEKVGEKTRRSQDISK